MAVEIVVDDHPSKHNFFQIERSCRVPRISPRRIIGGGGGERTEAGYRALLLKAGLRLTRVISTPGTSAIIEATRLN